MTNEEQKYKDNGIFKQIKIINNNQKEENITYNINKQLKNINYKLNAEHLLFKRNNTISFTKSQYIKFFSSFFNKEIKLKNPKNIKKNRTAIFSDKIIQTPSYLFNVRRKIINRSNIPLQKLKTLNIKQTILQSSIIKNVNKGNISTFIKPIRDINSITYNYLKFRNQNISRNYLAPIRNFSKIKKIKVKKNNQHLNNEDKSNKVSERRKHHNLLNVESIYILGKKKFKNYISNRSTSNEKTKINYKDYPLKSTYSVKKIKYPLLKNKFNKIIHENNEYLLEKIYKLQTVSNFNNKYQLRYKTRDDVKKEKMQYLFSLLKKYKYSDKDKTHIFHTYNRTNKAEK